MTFNQWKWAIYNGVVYPTRASVSTDIASPVHWVGPATNPPPIGGAYAIAGVDTWEVY